MPRYILQKSTRKDKKWMIFSPDDKVIHFGAEGFSDFTDHGDERRQALYLARHEKNENWTKAGIDTPGFWARWLLWSKPSLNEAIKYVNTKFDIHIVRKRE